MNTLLISIVVPIKNRAQELSERLGPWIKDTLARYPGAVEVVCVDDGSDDDTSKLLERLAKESNGLSILSLKSSVGPGPARDKGVEFAKGRWIFFLDSDDFVRSESFHELIEWLPFVESESDVIVLGEKAADPIQLASRVALFRADQEVWNYLFRLDYIKQKRLRFTARLHEDIRYVFQALLFARSTKHFDQKVVRKVESSDSITRTLSSQRIDGFLESLLEVLEIYATVGGDLHEYVSRNKIIDGFIGTILYLVSKEKAREGASLLGYLARRVQDLSQRLDLACSTVNPADTNYTLARSTFINAVLGVSKFDPGEALNEIEEIFSSRLTCKDINSSIFFGPTEIRACCKRFFVGGEQKGDTILCEASEDVTYDQIMVAKQRLVSKINRDEEDSCRGCPYLTRERIGNKTKVNYLSLENFSYCNLRCEYCSPKYYGGGEAAYDLGTILLEFQSRDEVASDCVVVWGGVNPL